MSNKVYYSFISNYYLLELLLEGATQFYQ